MPHCGEPLVLNNLLCFDLGLEQRMQFAQLKRREFITLVGSTVAAWPLAAHAQQADRKRRIGVLMTIAANDPEAQARIVVFAQALQALGWTDGRNARIDVRWSTTRSDT